MRKPKDKNNKPTLVILGTGFASYSLLKNIDCDFYNVVVISPRNYFLFTPLLHSSTVGTVEFRSIIEPVRKLGGCIEYFQAECISIDSEGNSVLCKSGNGDRLFKVAYDFLVIGTGAVNNTYGIPGAEEHALFLKELPDARKIRRKILTQFEQASVPELTEAERKQMLSFVVVGGGPTGVEFAAELNDLIEREVRTTYPKLFKLAGITLLEASSHILSAFDRNLAEYTLRLFERKHINVIRGVPVIEVRKDSVVLRDGRIISYGILVWSTGIGPTKLAKDTTFLKDRLERILTDNFLRVIGTKNIFAAGDCATIKNRPLPATAQIAQQEGLYLAKYLNRLAKGKKIKEFRDRNMGMLAYIGSRRALLDLPKVKGKGFGAYLLWRSIYLTKLISIRNKILVLMDWFKAIVFGRDLSII
ncbi:MAG: FAD-dependent oxidoreductase [Candidatus Kryptoniota bacterium]